MTYEEYDSLCTNLHIDRPNTTRDGDGKRYDYTEHALKNFRKMVACLGINNDVSKALKDRPSVVKEEYLQKGIQCLLPEKIHNREECSELVAQIEASVLLYKKFPPSRCKKQTVERRAKLLLTVFIDGQEMTASEYREILTIKPSYYSTVKTQAIEDLSVILFREK